jgi:hypothetical protein
VYSLEVTTPLARQSEAGESPALSDAEQLISLAISYADSKQEVDEDFSTSRSGLPCFHPPPFTNTTETAYSPLPEQQN